MKIAVNGTQINVVQAGSGEQALVFLHFWGGSSREWGQVMQGLSGQYRCIALDARGSGQSGAPAAGYRMADLADDVQGVVAALGLRSYVLVGHSMGGKTAQVLAGRRPAGLKGLALVASSPATPMPIDAAQREQMRGAYASAEAVGWVLDNVLTASPIGPEWRQVLVEDALQLSAPARDGWVDTGALEDCSGDIVAVDVPVLVVAGAQDKVDPIEAVRAHILPAFKDPEAHVLPGKGHLLPVEASATLVDLLARFAQKTLG